MQAKTKARKRPKTSLSPDKLLESLKRKELAPVYYFYASETPPRAMDKNRQSPYNDYLLDKVMDIIRQLVVGGDTKDFNYGMFIAGDTPLADAVAIASTYPMMRDKRLVIVKDAHEYKADDWRSAFAYLENPSPSTCLVLLGVHFPTQNKGGNDAKQAILNNATCVRFAPFNKPAEVAPYIKAELKARNMKMMPKAESMLLDLVGADLNEIVQSLEKLELFAANKDVIRVEDIEKCVAKTRIEDIWGLQDGLAERRLQAALPALGRLLENSKPADEIQLVGALIRLYTDLLNLRKKLDKGISPGRLKQETSGNPWAVDKKIKQASKTNSRALIKAINDLHKLDVAIRSSRVPNKVHFERFVMRACGNLA